MEQQKQLISDLSCCLGLLHSEGSESFVVRCQGHQGMHAVLLKSNDASPKADCEAYTLMGFLPCFSNALHPLYSFYGSLRCFSSVLPKFLHAAYFLHSLFPKLTPLQTPLPASLPQIVLLSKPNHLHRSRSLSRFFPHHSGSTPLLSAFQSPDSHHCAPTRSSHTCSGPYSRISDRQLSST